VKLPRVGHPVLDYGWASPPNFIVVFETESQLVFSFLRRFEFDET
jgi:hypothetical protein